MFAIIQFQIPSDNDGQKILTQARFPITDDPFYSDLPLSKIRIAFRIKAGDNKFFLASNLRVFTCIPGLVV